MALLQDFAFIVAKDLLVEDKATGEIKARLPYLVNLNLSDNQPIEYLRGGFERLKLLPFKGDRETALTCTTATTCPDLLELQMNTEFEEGTEKFKVTEKLKSADGNFTIEGTPAEGSVYNVWALDSVGKRTKLAQGDAAAAGVFSIAEGVITTEASVAAIEVIYEAERQAQVLKAKNVDTKTYKVTGIVVAQEVGTGLMYDVQIEIPSAVFQLNNQLDASNEGGVPENIEFTIDMLADAVEDYVYKLSFADVA